MTYTIGKVIIILIIIINRCIINRQYVFDGGSNGPG